MADIGTLTGTIEIVDHSGPAFTAFGSHLSTLSAKVDTTATKTAAFGASLGSIGSLLLAGGTIGAVSQLASTITDLASAALTNADALVKMSDKTGIGIESLGRLQAVADASGNTIQQIATGINLFQKNLGEGSTRATGALRELGLSVSDLAALNPENQFTTIASAIAKIPDPAKQAQLAMELFGRSGADLLPTLKANISAIGAAAWTMSADTVQALDAAGDAWTAFKRNAENAMGSFLGSIVLTFSKTGGIVSNAALEFQRLIDTVRAPVLSTGKPFDMGLPSEAQLQAMGLGINQIQKSITETHRATQKATADSEAAQKKLADELKRADDAAKKYVATIIKQVESTQELTLHTLKLGEALEEMPGTRFVPTLKDLAQFSLRSASDIDHLSGSVNALQRNGQFAEASLRRMGTTIATLPKRSPTAAEAWRDETAEVLKFDTGLGELARSFEQLATVSGDSFGGAVKDIATIVSAMDLAERATRNMMDGFKNLDSIKGWTQAIAGAIAAFAALQQATSGDNRTQATLGGAAAGASIGQTVGQFAGAGSVAGPWGAAIGALAGAIYGYWRSSQARAEMRAIGHEWGVEVTAALKDQIKSDSKNLFADSPIVNGHYSFENKPNMTAAEIYNLRSLVEAAGGLDSSNLDKFTGKLRDVFVMLQQGVFTTTQAVQVLDENWAAFAEAGTDATGRLSDGLREIVQLSITNGTVSKAMADWMKGQGADAIAGFADVVAGAALNSEQALADMGLQAMAAINAAIAAGMTLPQALRAAGPALQRLLDGYRALGLNINNAALQALMFQSSLMTNNPALIAGIDGLSTSMIALANLGRLNVETFGAMERTGFDMYTRLQDEVARMGGTTADALGPMQGYLHAAEAEARRLGIPLDANTQRMIDQSRELGLWQEAGPTATDQMVAGMEKVVKSLDALIARMDKIIKTQFPDKSFTVTEYHKVNPNAPPPGTPPAPPPAAGAASAGYTSALSAGLLDFGGRSTTASVAARVPTDTGRPGATVINIVPLLHEVRALRADQQRANDFFANRFDKQLSRAVRDENQKAKRLG